MDFYTEDFQSISVQVSFCGGKASIVAVEGCADIPTLMNIEEILAHDVSQLDQGDGWYIFKLMHFDCGDEPYADTDIEVFEKRFLAFDFDQKRKGFEARPRADVVSIADRTMEGGV